MRSPDQRLKARTARSFAYEWAHFDTPPSEIGDNFWNYFQYFDESFFQGKRVLEVGPGMGRHTYYLASHSEFVVAADIGDAIHVARKNTRQFDNIGYLKADIYREPFAPDQFDFVCAVGVLPCVPDPDEAFWALAKLVRPGGTLHIYVYWALEDAPTWQRLLLRAVNSTRIVTTRLPYPLVNAIAWAAAVGGYTLFSLPYGLLSRYSRTRAIAERLPLKRYARDGFRVCHNDQFDRLSAPVEHRHKRAEVEDWFRDAGFTGIRVEPASGWIACGQKPS